MKLSIVPAAALVAVTSVCHGGVEKIAVPTDQGLQLYWWPKVDPPKGFEFDQNASYANGVKMFVLRGRNFSNADTVIYAKAIYKPRAPETTSLKELLDQDTANVKEHDASIKVSPSAAILDGDRKQLPVLMFSPSNQGNWELVVYGEEGDYYLLFTISSRTRKGYEQALPAFKAMIASYHENP